MNTSFELDFVPVYPLLTIWRLKSYFDRPFFEKIKKRLLPWQTKDVSLLYKTAKMIQNQGKSAKMIHASHPDKPEFIILSGVYPMYGGKLLSNPVVRKS